MSLAAGTKLGPYEIVAPIGKGGMGEVYRANDTKLKRDVALKVLPEAFARDPERLGRFEREAEVLASLNHPNIASIYGVVEDRALVMELVEGAEPKGPLPFDEAWAIASQMAAAMEYAHEKGVVHRDLKPANIKVTPDGVVKLLDFGLAKAFTTQREASPATAENSPTLTINGTEVGMILGTAAYMAPEQAKGKTVDKRADVWAFGVVLYELLTGERLFKGEDVSDTLAQVLTKQPDMETVPPKARSLLRACLEKDPKLRLRDIGDARRLIEQAPAAESAPSRSRLGWMATVAALLVVTALLGFGWWRSARSIKPPLKPLVRLDVDLGIDVSLALTTATPTTQVIISPDGTRLVYLSQNRLFTRRLDQPKASELAGTEGAGSAFFSPDGQWIAFMTSSQLLKKISVEGGAAITLCGGVGSYGGSWGEDGNIIAGPGPGHGLARIPSAGGAPTFVTELPQGEVAHIWPQILPGGKAVLFTAATSRGGGFDDANIEVVSLADHHRKTVQRGGTFGRYLPSGHLVYVNGGTLFAVPFDPDKLEVRGAPVPVLDQVSYSPNFGSAQFDFSRAGTLVYRSAGAGNTVALKWLDGAGKMAPLLAKPGMYGRPHVSPDGQRVALEVSDGSSGVDVWVFDWQRGNMRRLTFASGSINMNPVWSPDGRYIVFHGRDGILWTRSDGSGKAQSLTQSRKFQLPFSFTPDGRRLAWNEPSVYGYDLWTMPLESDDAGLRAGKPEAFLQTPFDERHPMFSPDARWMAYSSNESGPYQVYVRTFPDKGGKWQVSNEGGVYPEWSHNGRELFFRAPDNRIMVAAYAAKGDTFAADKPRVWSEKRLVDFGIVGSGTYDLAPDGRRIAALIPADEPGAQQAQSHVIFLENFFDELRRKVPVIK